MWKKIFTFLLILLIAMGTLFTFLFVKVINDYKNINNINNNLLYEELHYVSYEKDNNYYIYFSEYDNPFLSSSIVNKKINKDELDKIKFGDLVKVYYQFTKSKTSDYEVCEVMSDTNYILKLDDYIDVNKSNLTIGIIVNFLLICDVVFLMFVLIKSYKSSKKELDDNNSNKTILGKEKINCFIDGNLIQLFNSYSVCSLVINNEVVDQYKGVVAGLFCLKGEIDGNIVEAKMGYVNMKLYYNGKLIKKIFMGLG